MITWMQRHKKYLIITIWISTIAFVGAGFVGWGQYSYGDKAGAVAKVGQIEITMGELQKSYSRLYSQYNQMFQGDFDEEKAKTFGLQRQALNQLTNQALVLNLAHDYDLRINDKELLKEITSQEHFFKDGKFDKTIYKETLSRVNLSTKEYEEDIKKQLLIQKLFKLLPIEQSKGEAEILSTIMNIADKIEYKVIDDSNISIETSDALLKPYWEQKQQNFMTEVSYKINYLKQEKIIAEYSQEEITKHYQANKNHFKDAEGKILPQELAQNLVLEELNAKATKEKALRTYIAFKKRKLQSDVKVEEVTISRSNNPFNEETLEKLQSLSLTSPFLKPLNIDGEYYTFELVKINPSKIKTYEEVKSQIVSLYTKEEKRKKLASIAKNSLDTFNGTTTEFITNQAADKIIDLELNEANEFLMKLFNSKTKKGIISLESGKIVLYDILEQKMLDTIHTDDESIASLKSRLFNDGLIKKLNNSYQTEIFVQGL